jgi:HEAT repeat protein
MDTTTYTSPVNKLLTLGKPESSLPEEWPNYLEFDLGPQHIPDLIRMATDPVFRGPEAEKESEEDDPDFWAPLHAIRALGQLHAEAAIEPLVNMLPEVINDDWIQEELPQVFVLIGPPAIPALSAYLTDSSNDMYSRGSAAENLETIGRRYPESRSECISIISKQLEKFEENDYELNAFLIATLSRLKAVETLPLIELYASM